MARKLAVTLHAMWRTGTRNCRLAAIRSFFNYVATRDPASIAQCVEIFNIPLKRAPVSEPCYLEPAEVAAILA